jgi:hypothetical protein
LKPTRRKALGAALLAAGALAVVPSDASATTQSCAGHWGKATKADTAALTTKYGVQYTFACRQNIHSFAVVTSRTVDVFSVSASSFDPKTQAPGLIFGCEGPIPGNGTSCFGANATDKAPAGYVVRGQVGATKSPCGWDPRSPVPFTLSLIVSDNGGTLAGPFRLKQPRGCAARYAKAKKAARSR